MLTAAVLALAAAMFGGGCSRGAATGASAGVPVLVARAFTTNVPVLIDPPPVGHVMPYSMVTIHSQIGGIISEVHFTQGQEVKQGDLLFTIDPRPSQAALDAARAALQRDEAQLTYAKVNFEREKKLFEQKLISQDELETTQANMNALGGTTAADRAAITNAMLNLEFCQISAPIDGVTGSLLFYQGNVVKAPDDTLLTINQIRPIYVQFGVEEQFLPAIRREMRDHTLKVVASFDNMDEPPPQGELTFIDNTVDPTTGLIQLKATFPNTRRVLWPGQYVHVALTLSELTNVVVVPSQAVQTGQNGQYAYVVDSSPADDTVEQRAVKIGINYGGLTVIESGLQAGETVVTDGQLRLSPGAKVNAKGK
ncbi:MAG: efflux RND transporter periplasmic adaptor subunit [Verrucomicrobiota bacterium]